MGLECLLITCDSTLLGQIKSAFGARAQSLELRQNAASAIELVRRRHLDGIVIDCDDVTGGTEAITQVRTTRSNRDTPIIAVVNGLTSAGAALDLGANFILCKPVQELDCEAFSILPFPGWNVNAADIFAMTQICLCAYRIILSILLLRE